MIARPLTAKTFLKYAQNPWHDRDFAPLYGMRSVLGSMSAPAIYRKWYSIYLDEERAIELHCETGLSVYCVEEYRLRYERNNLLGYDDTAAVWNMAMWATRLEGGESCVWAEVDLWAHLPMWDEDEPRKVSYEIVKGEVVTVIYGESTRLF